ncbi:MAG: cation:proton antiporter [Alloprevotella sp.]|nr:cation:proton antiporter [Alloprevotella sp.]
MPLSWPTFPIENPTWIFFLVLGIILLAPALMRRLHIPSIAGLIIAGIVIGPYGLNVLVRDDSFELFGKVGLYYIMFLAALEMNLRDISNSRLQTFLFGLLTFAIPMSLGFVANSLLGYGIAAAMLMAAMYASHTLVSYPIVLRYGVSKRKSVSLAVGGTIIADTLTLLVLALISGSYQTNTSDLYWLWLLLKVLAIGTAILFIFPRISRFFFRKVNDGVVQYIFVLGLVFLSAGLMELAGMEGILGAFLAGLVLNRLIPATSPLMNHIEFIGNALFIPYFLIGVGMLIDLRSLFQLKAIEVALVMIGVSVGSKWLAATIGQLTHKLKPVDRALIFGLTGSRAAATLAIALVGYNILLPDGSRLFDDVILNGAMLLILVSCIISSFSTEWASRKIMLSKEIEPIEKPAEDRIVLAVNAPAHVEPLVNLALTIRTPRSTQPLAAINIVTDDNPKQQAQGKESLELAAKLSAAANIRMQTHLRWSVNIVSGLSHAMKELDASDLLIGLHRKTRLMEPFFGSLGSDLLATITKQIIVYRAMQPLNTIRMLHLVVPRSAEFEPAFSAWADRVALLASHLDCQMQVYSGNDTLMALQQYWEKTGVTLRCHYEPYNEWNDFLPLANRMRPNHLVIFVWARENTVSRHPYFNMLATQLEKYFSTRNLMMIMPAQNRGTIGKTSVLIAK